MNIYAIINREVRIIPKGWQYPEHRPLLRADDWPADADALTQWQEDHETTDLPQRDDYMPSVEGLPTEETEIMVYETTSEGSPISPAFPNTPEGRLELVVYCTGHCSTFASLKTGPEEWAAILFGDGGVTDLAGRFKAFGETPPFTSPAMEEDNG